MGVLWDKKLDLIRPNWNFNSGEKLKGEYKLGELSLEQLDTLVLTRRIYTRILCQCYDPLGLWVQHFSMNLKSFLKKE